MSQSIYTVLISSVGILLVACAGNPVSFAASPTPTLPPTSTIVASPMPTLSPTLSIAASPTPGLLPVQDFVEGRSEIPAGKYLFMEYWRAYDGKSTTDTCPNAAMIDFPMYSYSDTLDASSLDLGRGARNLAPPPLGFFGYGDSHHGAMGGGVSSELYTIEALPYVTPPYETAIIHAVDEQGRAVVEIEDSTYLIEPGQSWFFRVEDDPTPECHTTTTYTLTNYGLLDQSQISTTSDYELDYLRRVGTTASSQLAWETDGNALVHATKGGVRFYSVSPLVEIDILTTSTTVLSLAMSPDGSELAFGDADGAIQLYDLAARRLVGEPLSDPPGPWINLAFNPNGKLLVSGSYDGIIQLWDLDKQESIGTPWVYSAENLEFTSDGQRLLSGSILLDIRAGQPVETIGGAESQCAVTTLNPEGSMLACFGHRRVSDWAVIYLIDRATGDLLRELPDKGPVHPGVLDLAFSPDGSMLAAGSDYGTVQVWDVSTGEIRGRWTLANGASFDYVTTVAFSPDGSKLAACNRTGGGDWTIWLLDLETHQTATIGEIW